MKRSKCCEAPIVQEHLSCCQEPDTNPSYKMRVTVDVCKDCGSILFAHKAQMEMEEALLEPVLK